MSERDKILTACGWMTDAALPLIAERIVNYSAGCIAELKAQALKQKEAWNQHMEVAIGNAGEIVQLERQVEILEARNINDKHLSAESPGTLMFNEVTGLHAEADEYRIAELEQETQDGFDQLAVSQREVAKLETRLAAFENSIDTDWMKDSGVGGE